MRIPPLLGEADRTSYVAQIRNGEEIHPNEGVFPLIVQEKNGDFRFVGTGFFIAPGAIFLTAAHVVAEADDENSRPKQPLGAIQFSPSGKYYIRSVHVAARNSKADVAIGYLNPLQHFETSEPYPNRVVTLSAENPKPGEKIVTFAYPKTRVTQGKKQKLDFEPAYYAGEVVEHWPNGRDTVLLPGECYQTTMVIHGGASGGPVFGSNGGVFGLNSTGYDNEHISFVSSVWSALDLPLPNMCIGINSSPRTTSMRELINLGIIHVK